MKKNMFYFSNGFVFQCKANATFEELAESVLTEALSRLSQGEKHLFVNGVETFYKARTLAGTTVCVVRMTTALKNEFPSFYDGKKPLCAAIAELEAEEKKAKRREKNSAVEKLQSYYSLSRSAWVERKDSLRRLETAGMLETADADCVRVMVGDIIYEAFLAAYRKYNNADYRGYAPASEISAQANHVAETLSTRRGLGNATRAECADYLKTFVFNGGSYTEDHVNGILWAEQQGTAERIYGNCIADAFRTALASLGYSSATLEDIKRMQRYPVREVDELGKRMLAIMNGEDWVLPLSKIV